MGVNRTDGDDVQETGEVLEFADVERSDIDSLDVPLVLQVNSVAYAQVALAKLVADFEGGEKNDGMIVGLEATIRAAINHGDERIEVTEELLESAKAAYVVLATEKFIYEHEAALNPSNSDHKSRQASINRLEVLLSVFEEFGLEDDIKVRFFRARIEPLVEDLEFDFVDSEDGSDYEQ